MKNKQEIELKNKEEIANNDYDLSINRYKELSTEIKECEDPRIVLNRIIEEEKIIQQKLSELEEIL